MQAELNALVAKFRVALVMILAFGVVVIDSVSRVVSMLADMALVGILLAVVWPLLKESTAEKQ